MDSQTAPVLRPSGGDLPLSMHITNTVAWLEGVDPTALTPLQDVIDVDALQELFTDTDRTGVTAAFEYEGHHIDCNSDGTIAVEGTPTSIGGTVAAGTSILCVSAAEKPTEKIEWPTYTTASPSDHRAWLEVVVLGDEDSSVDDVENKLDLSVTAATQRTIFVCEPEVDVSTQISPRHRLGIDHDQQQGETQIETIGCGNLSTLGQRMSEQLSVWETIGASSAVRIHSLSPLLETTALSRLFQFFHLLTGQTASTGTVLQVQCDTNQVSEQTINTLSPLFDMVIEFNMEGECTLTI